MKLSTIAITENFHDLKEVDLLAKEAFPPAEYLPPKLLIEMTKSQGLDFWALYDGKLFVGFMAVKAYKNMAYLFFLAILSKFRASGYGGRAIETLKSLYPSMEQVVDIEAFDTAAENREQRKRRRRFYLRNGHQPTGLYLSYLGVDYEVLCMNENFDRGTFKELLNTLQIDGFCPRFFSF